MLTGVVVSCVRNRRYFCDFAMTVNMMTSSVFLQFFSVIIIIIFVHDNPSRRSFISIQYTVILSPKESIQSVQK